MTMYSFALAQTAIGHETHKGVRRAFCPPHGSVHESVCDENFVRTVNRLFERFPKKHLRVETLPVPCRRVRFPARRPLVQQDVTPYFHPSPYDSLLKTFYNHYIVIFLYLLKFFVEMFCGSAFRVRFPSVYRSIMLALQG